jgi:hypothetical protein
MAIKNLQILVIDNVVNFLLLAELGMGGYL